MSGAVSGSDPNDQNAITVDARPTSGSDNTCSTMRAVARSRSDSGHGIACGQDAGTHGALRTLQVGARRHEINAAAMTSKPVDRPGGQHDEPRRAGLAERVDEGAELGGRARPHAVGRQALRRAIGEEPFEVLPRSPPRGRCRPTSARRRGRSRARGVAPPWSRSPGRRRPTRSTRPRPARRPPRTASERPPTHSAGEPGGSSGPVSAGTCAPPGHASPSNSARSARTVSSSSATRSLALG